MENPRHHPEQPTGRRSDGPQRRPDQTPEEDVPKTIHAKEIGSSDAEPPRMQRREDPEVAARRQRERTLYAAGEDYTVIAEEVGRPVATVKFDINFETDPDQRRTLREQRQAARGEEEPETPAKERRSAVVAAILQGVDRDEIADRLGIPRHQVNQDWATEATVEQKDEEIARRREETRTRRTVKREGRRREQPPERESDSVTPQEHSEEVQEIQEQPDQSSEESEEKQAPPIKTFSTPRERRNYVVSAITTEGKTIDEVAEELGMSPRQVYVNDWYPGSTDTQREWYKREMEKRRVREAREQQEARETRQATTEPEIILPSSERKAYVVDAIIEGTRSMKQTIEDIADLLGKNPKRIYEDWYWGSTPEQKVAMRERERQRKQQERENRTQRSQLDEERDKHQQEVQQRRADVARLHAMRDEGGNPQYTLQQIADELEVKLTIVKDDVHVNKTRQGIQDDRRVEARRVAEQRKEELLTLYSARTTQGDARYSIPEIAEALGVSEGTVYGYLNEIESKGLVERRIRRGSPEEIAERRARVDNLSRTHSERQIAERLNVPLTTVKRDKRENTKRHLAEWRRKRAQQED